MILDELPEMRFEFPFNLIGKMTMALLAAQSWCIIKSWYTGGGPEQGFRSCFAKKPVNTFLINSALALKLSRRCW